MNELVHDGWRSRRGVARSALLERLDRLAALGREIRPQIDVRSPEATRLLGILVRASEAACDEHATQVLADLERMLLSLAKDLPDSYRRRLAKALPALAPRSSATLLEDFLEAPDPEQPLIVLDTETTGLVAGECQVIEVYALRVQDGQPGVDELHRLVLLEPGARVDATALAVNGMDPYSAEHLRDAVSLHQVIEELDAWIGNGATIVAHNASFDRRMLEADARRVGLELCRAKWFCTKLWAQALQRRGAMPAIGARLADLCAHFGIVQADAHRAKGDVEATLAVFDALRRVDEAYEEAQRAEQTRGLVLAPPTKVEPKSKKKGRAA